MLCVGDKNTKSEISVKITDLRRYAWKVAYTSGWTLDSASVRTVPSPNGLELLIGDESLLKIRMSDRVYASIAG